MNGIEIAIAVNRIIFYLKKEEFDEAINWRDLDVADVEERRSIIGGLRHPTIHVIIEEASPECPKFCRKIEEIFFKKYKKIIYIHTEW